MKTMKKQTTTAFLIVVLGLCQLGLADLRAQGPQEGIKVHGHWTIDVRQPDGTLVTHREFENALQSGGAGRLGDFLSRRLIPGAWSVILAGTPPDLSDGPCLNGASVASCWIAEPGFAPTDNAPYFFRNLAFGPSGFVLSGTATAGRAGVVGSVSTMLFACDSIAASGPNPTVPECASGVRAIYGAGFSAVTLSPAINVAIGQLIQVKVTFSFS